jgi:preprotein translocase subunit SecA/LysM repeat protein
VEINLLGLFFEEEYYQLSVCPQNECNLSNALAHYIEHAKDKCFPPSVYFEQNQVLLYKDTSKTECITGDWLKPLSVDNIDSNKDIIKSYIFYLHKNGKGRYIQEFVASALDESPAGLELLLGKAPIDNNIITAFSKKPSHHFSDQSISYLENLYNNPKTNSNTKSNILSIVMNFAAKFATDATHAKFLSEVMKSNDGLIENGGTIFLAERLFNAKIYDKEVFANFAEIASAPTHKDMLQLIAYGAMDKIYYPKSPVYLELFQQEILPEETANSKSNLFFSALVETLYDQISNNIIMPGKLDNIVASMIDKGYTLPAHLVDKISGLYKAQSESFVAFLNNKPVLSTKAQIDAYTNQLDSYNNKIAYLSHTIERIVDNSKILPQSTLVRLADASLKIAGVTEDFQIIKSVVFIVGRIYQQHAQLPINTLNSFDKLLQNSDLHIQKLALSLFKKLSKTLPIDNADALLSINGNLDTKLDILEILSNESKGNFLSSTQKQNFSAFVDQVNQELAKDRVWRVSDNILQSIRSKNIQSWGVEKESVFKNQLNSIFTRADWSLDAVTRITNILTSNNLEYFEQAVEKIYDYGMSHRLINRDGQDIVELIEQQKPEEWVSSIKKLYGENDYYTPSTVDELLGDILIGDAKLDHIDIDQKQYLQDKLQAIKQSMVSLNTASWTDQDFLTWRKKITKVDDDNIAEVVAVLGEAVYQTSDKHYYPRDVQLMSLLMLFKSDTGRLAQIGTGEGKSMIVSMLAAINVLSGHHVDIITSSMFLAQRDAIEQAGFYTKLGITVAHNIRIASNNNDALKECYNADVVYGDLLNFIGDNLSDINDNVKNGRGFDILIVDEVDNMFIDQTSMKVQKGGHIPGFEHLRKVLVYIWGFQNLVMNFITKDEAGNFYLSQPVYQENSTGEKEVAYYNNTLLVDVPSYIKNLTLDYIENHLCDFAALREDREVVLPKHIQGFVIEHLPNWVNASMEARSRVENVSYVVRNQNYYNESLQINQVIAPVDQDTGVIQFNLNWGDGLSQFLQIKHGLRLTPETLISIFQSYVSYFLKYKGNIYGLTGTLGTDSHKEFLHKIYGVDFVEIPNFQHKKQSIFPERIIINDQDKWLSNIAEIVQHKATSDRRAVLVVAKNIEQMQLIAEFLISKGNIIAEYGHNPDQAIVEEVWTAGKIVVATNVAGRGTNIEINKEVERNLGLHVILSFFPDSLRVGDQAFGRAARKGESGSAQLVINQHANDNLADLNYKRDRDEYKNMRNDELCKIPDMLIHDGLFDQFVELIRSNDSPTRLEIITLYNNWGKELSLNQAGVYIKDGEIFIKAAKGSSFTPFIASSDLKKIDEKIYNHILSILLKPDNPATFSKRDLEAVHFLLAKGGYSVQGAAVVKRVEEKYKSLWPVSDEFLSSFAKDLWTKDGGGSNFLFSLASGEIGKFVITEVAYLESLLKEDKNYKPEDLTKETLLNAKLKDLYKLWLKDREIYNQHFEILQAQELWARWLSAQDKIIAEQNQCDLLAAEDPSDDHLLKLIRNRDKLKEQLNKAFISFYESISSKWKNGILFDNENPAYVIRKAYDKQNVHDYQTTISRTMNGFLGLAGAALKMIAGFSLEEFWYEKAPLDQAITLLNKAVKMDPQHAWMAYNGLAFMDLIKESPHITDLKEHQAKAVEVMNRFVGYANNALENLYTVTIPQAEALLSYILLNNVTQGYTDLAIQQIVNVKILQSIAKSIEKNINIIASSEGGQMIRVSKILVLDRLFNTLNATDVVGQYYNLTNLDTQSLNALNRVSGNFNLTMYKDVIDNLYLSGALAFEIELYELQEDDDWFGTIFSAVFGIAQILIGVALFPIGGPFVTAFAYGLIAGGISDILSSMISVIQGIPIDLDGYLRSKAIGLAINVITAGIACIGASLSAELAIANVNINAPGVLSNLLIQQLGYQVALMGVTALVQNAGNQIINSNDGNIEQSIRNAIGDLLLEHKEELKVIFASDEVEGTKFLYKLLVSSYDISRDYAKRFNSDFAKVAKGVIPSAARTFGAFGGIGMATGIAVTAASAAVNVGMGLIKVDEATDDFAENFAQTIKNTASSISSRSKYMMQNLLKNSFPGEVSSMMMLLEANSFVTNQDIDYQNCNRIDQFSMQQYEESRKAIKSACQKIQRLMSDKHMLSYQINLHDSLSKVVFGHIKGMVKADIVAPLANFIGSMAGDYAMDAIKNHQKITQQFKDMQAEVKSTQKDTTTDTSTPPPPKKEEQPTEEANAKPRTEQAPDPTKNKQPKGAPEPKTQNAQTQEMIIDYKEPKVGQTDGKQYKIKSGDTVSKIAKSNGVTVEDILEANPQISNPDVIKLGAKIIIPTSKILIKHDNPPAHNSKPANDNVKTPKKTAYYGEVFGPEMPQHLKKRMSFVEFSDSVSNKLEIDKQDKATQDYIKETYQAYIDNGAVEVSKFGMHAHETGILIEQFKQDNPNLSSGIKLAVDVTGKIVGIFVDGVIYIFKPLGGVWEAYRDFVNNNIVPKKWNEWLVEQENKLINAGGEWHDGLTSKQKLAFETTVETVDFGANFALVGSAVKIGTKVAIEASYKIGASGIAAEKILYDNKNGLVYKVANDNFDLFVYEDVKFGGKLVNGGHAIEKHVGKSAEWLKDRLDKSPRITGSTSFPDLATANKYTKETLIRNADAIESWLGDMKSPRTQSFLAEFNSEIGYGYNKNNQFFNSINKVNVVLKKTENGFIVYTSHPIVDKVK